MPEKTRYTARDELWTACQRVSYVNLVKRAAAGTSCFRDLAWLNTALDALELTHMDYELDVASVQAGNIPPRLRGQWGELGPIVTRTVNEIATL